MKTPLLVRLTESEAARVKRYARKLADKAGENVSWSSAMRALILRGLEIEEKKR